MTGGEVAGTVGMITLGMATEVREGKESVENSSLYFVFFRVSRFD